MNDTRQQWAYRSAGLQALIENQRAQHNSHKGSNTATAAWSKVLGETEQQLCTRGTILFSWKQYCRTQEGKCLPQKAVFLVSVATASAVKNGF
jgi:hypothetical protein